MDNVAFYIFLCLELCYYIIYAHLFHPVLAMQALFVHILLVGCPVVILLGCMCLGPSNNNMNKMANFSFLTNVPFHLILTILITKRVVFSWWMLFKAGYKCVFY